MNFGKATKDIKKIAYFSRDGWIYIQQLYNNKKKVRFFCKLINTIPFIFFMREEKIIIKPYMRKKKIIVKNYIFGRKIYTLLERYK